MCLQKQQSTVTTYREGNSDKLLPNLESLVSETVSEIEKSKIFLGSMPPSLRQSMYTIIFLASEKKRLMDYYSPHPLNTNETLMMVTTLVFMFSMHI